jgi:hypothetical protein
MRPEIRTVIVAAIITVIAAVCALKKWGNLRANLGLLADSLDAEIIYPILGIPAFAKVIGRYKGREVVCAFNLFISRYGNAKFSIAVRPIPEKGVPDQVAESIPLENYWIDDNRIYCLDPIEDPARRSIWKREASLSRPLARHDIIAYLDKLTIAAETVEKSAPEQVAVKL